MSETRGRGAQSQPKSGGHWKDKGGQNRPMSSPNRDDSAWEASGNIDVPPTSGDVRQSASSPKNQVYSPNREGGATEPWSGDGLNNKGSPNRQFSSPSRDEDVRVASGKKGGSPWGGDGRKGGWGPKRQDGWKNKGSPNKGVPEQLWRGDGRKNNGDPQRQAWSPNRDEGAGEASGSLDIQLFGGYGRKGKGGSKQQVSSQSRAEGVSEASGKSPLGCDGWKNKGGPKSPVVSPSRDEAGPDASGKIEVSVWRGDEWKGKGGRKGQDLSQTKVESVTEASGKMAISTWGDDEVVPEQEEYPDADEGSYRGNAPNKRHLRNPIANKFYKRKRMDRTQASNGHMRFEEKEFPLLEYTDYLRAQMEIEDHFNKKFSFAKPPADGENAWKLPSAETMYTKKLWQDEDLQSAKSTLNKVKRQLTDKDISSWHTHTKNTNPAEKIAVTVRRRAAPEMVTQAWLKFYEIVSTYPLVPHDDHENLNEEDKENVSREKTFHSVHLCEAPGAFITALNHYLVLVQPEIKWQWVGNTLNPYYEGSPAEICVVEDKFIHHTMHNWTFGQNNTGDLMEKENLEDLVQRADYIGPIHLVTADGSMDCQTSPAEQENMTHNLHLCEVVSALSILAPGGSLVVKKFTMFESETINLMYLLCCVFKEVHIVKPGTSKEGNSEVYVVCVSYSGKESFEPHLQKLVDVYGTFGGDLAMFGVEELPKDFMFQLKKCGEVFKAHQINTITKNVSLFGRMTEKDDQYNELLKVKANSMYFERSFCDHIPKERTLTDNKVNKSRYLLESDLSKPITSALVRSTCPAEKLAMSKKLLNTYLEEFCKRSWIIEITKQETHNIAKYPKVDFENIEFDVLRGTPYTTIKSSRLCSQKIQEIFRVLYKVWGEFDDAPALTLDDSLLEFAVKDYPNAEVLRSLVTPAPTSDLGAMMEVLVKIKEKKLSTDDSCILVNVTLLSRLQCGLLLLLSSAFQNVMVYTSLKYGEQNPIIVFENFKSAEQGEAVINAVQNTGWSPFEDSATSAKFLQLISFHLLTEHVRLCGLYYYNLHHCVHRSMRLQSGIEDMLK